MDAPEEQVSYEMLQELVRAERRSNKLMPVRARFWPEVRSFLEAVTQEFRAEQERDPWSRKAMLLSDEVKNARHAAENLWALRERKLAMLALARERDRKRPDGITADEGRLYEEMGRLLDSFRAQVAVPPLSAGPAAPSAPAAGAATAAETPSPDGSAPDPGPRRPPPSAAPAEASSPQPPAPPAVVPADLQGQDTAVTIRALGDIPPFVGPDMHTYLLKEGDLATVPPSIAELLVRRKKAAVVTGA